MFQIPVDDMQIGATDAAGLDPKADLLWPAFGW
jgi:hypothetical protein